MAKKQKACVNCKMVYEGQKCPNCGESLATEGFEGRIFVFNAEESEAAKNMGIEKNGEFAIKTK